jgi:hypothetical protein
VDAISTGLIKIIVEDVPTSAPSKAAAPSKSGGSFDPHAAPPTRPVMPSAPVPSIMPAKPAAATPREQMVKDLAATPGAAKAGLSPEVLAGMKEDMLRDLHEKVVAAIPRPGPTATEQVRREQSATPTAPSATRPTKPAAATPRPEPEVYGFADPKDRLEHGQAYGLKPAEKLPPGLPRARPVDPAPTAAESVRPAARVAFDPDQFAKAGETIAKNFLGNLTPRELRPIVSQLTDSLFRVGSPAPAAKPQVPVPTSQPTSAATVARGEDKAVRTAAAQVPKPSTAAAGASGLPRAAPVAAEGAAAGEAAGAATGMARVAAAAGPAAIAAVAMAAAGMVAQKALTHVGDRASELAQNDNLGMIEDGATVAKAGLIALGPVTAGASTAMAMVTPVVKEFNKVANAFVERGKELQRSIPALLARTRWRTPAPCRTTPRRPRHSARRSPGLRTTRARPIQTCGRPSFR